MYARFQISSAAALLLSAFHLLLLDGRGSSQLQSVPLLLLWLVSVRIGLVLGCVAQLYQLLEALIDSDTAFSRAFEVIKAKLLRQHLTFGVGHLAAVLKIALVADYNLADAVGRELVDFLHPLPHIFESVTVSHVVNDYYTVSPAVVAGRQRTKSLLTGCVPNLELNVLIIKRDRFDLEVDSNRVKEVLIERILCVPHE